MKKIAKMPFYIILRKPQTNFPATKAIEPAFVTCCRSIKIGLHQPSVGTHGQLFTRAQDHLIGPLSGGITRSQQLTGYLKCYVVYHLPKLRSDVTSHILNHILPTTNNINGVQPHLCNIHLHSTTIEPFCRQSPPVFDAVHV